MSKLRITLLGSPEIRIDGKIVSGFHSAKTRMLLFYLALSNQSHSRASLAGFLWGGLPDQNATNNLRKSLTNLRQLVGTHLHIERESVAFIHSEASWVDAQVFELSINQPNPSIEQLIQAIGHYRSDLLEGFYVRDAPEVEAWILSERLRFQDLFQTTLFQLAETQLAVGRPTEGIQTGKRLVSLDPLHEASHRLLMNLYVASGQRNRALAQYENCSATLAAELDLPPSAETTGLYETILSSGDVAEVKGLSFLRGNDGEEREILREKVRRFWIDGVLKHTAHLSPPIDLQWKCAPSFVKMPWSDVRANHLDTPFDEEPKKLREVYESAERALLILGAAGGGKTFTLLKLAETLLKETAVNPHLPIPVVLLLSSWVNDKRPLAEWVVEQLMTRYQIPRRLGRRWLDGNKLALLLDGLDEVDRAEQAACITAINQFRETHGLSGIVVCCRRGVAEAHEKKLQLDDAIMLQPLSVEQAEAYLKHAAPQFSKLRQEIKQQVWLKEIIHSPLLLNILTVAWQERGEQVMSERDLLGHFVANALARWKAQKADGDLLANQRLAWLARRMDQHRQTAVYLELLQPSWLEQRGSRWLYIFLTRLLIAGFLGVAMALLYRAGTLDQPQFRLELFATAGRWLPIAPLWQETVGFMILAQMHWVFAALIDGVWFEWRRKNRNEGLFSKLQAVIFIGIHAVASLGYIVAVALPFDSAVISFFSGTLLVYFMTLAFGYWSHAQSYQLDIKPSASLGWSWRGAAYGMLFGLLLGLVFTALGNPIGTIFLLVLAATVTGGLRRLGLDRSFRPNQGIYATARNALIGGVTQGMIPLLLFGWSSSFEFTLLTSLVAAGIGAMLFGGATLIKHGVLRLLLYLESGLPFNLAHFLDQASRVSLMRRVGGGYIFFHRLLQDYFSEK